MCELPQCIKLKLLLNKLTLPDKKELIDEIIKLFGFEFIFEALFRNFYYNNNFDCNKQMNKLQEMIKSIILKKKKPKKQKKFKLNYLPYVLISKLASYLNQTSYNSLQLVNRNIYYGCNKPYSLCQINVTKHMNNSQLIISKIKLKQASSLRISFKYFNKIINKQFQNKSLNNIKSLGLISAGDKKDVKEFLENSKCINNVEIKKLEIGNLRVKNTDKYAAYNGINDKCIISLLNQFQNIKHLTLSGYASSKYISEFDKHNLPLLKYLDSIHIKSQFVCIFWWRPIVEELIIKHSHQLKSLQFEVGGDGSLFSLLECNSNNDGMYKFPKLEKLHFHSHGMNDLVLSNNTIFTLKELTINVGKSINDGERYYLIKPSSINNIIKYFFQTQQNLQHVVLYNKSLTLTGINNKNSAYIPAAEYNELFEAILNNETKQSLKTISFNLHANKKLRTANTEIINYIQKVTMKYIHHKNKIMIHCTIYDYDNKWLTDDMNDNDKPYKIISQQFSKCVKITSMFK